MKQKEKLWKVDIATEGMLLRTVIAIDDELSVLKRIIQKKKLDPQSLRSISVEPIPPNKEVT